MDEHAMESLILSSAFRADWPILASAKASGSKGEFHHISSGSRHASSSAISAFTLAGKALAA
jgi:hypothetical protein